MPDIKSFAPAITLLAGFIIALSGCSPETPADPGNGSSEAGTKPSASVNPVPESGERQVVAQKVLSGDTVVVTPKDESDPLYGQQLTVLILDLRAPQEGECGFEASKAFAEDFFSPANGDPNGGGLFDMDYPDESGPVEPVDESGEHRAALGSGAGSYTSSIAEGYTIPNDETGSAAYFEEDAAEAKAGKKGVYAECPDFGEK